MNLRKKLFFASCKFPIEIFAQNSCSVIAYKYTIRIEHGNDFEANIIVINPFLYAIVS